MRTVSELKEGLSESQGVQHWIVATGLTALTTVGLELLHANSTTAGMVFLAMLVWVSTQAGIKISLYVAALCAVCFDFFFLLPFHTFRLAGAQQWLEMLTFAASCLVVSRVAERARRQTLDAQQRRRDVERLYELSQEMMLYEDADGLLRELPRLIDRIFSLSGVVLYACARDQFYASTSDLPMSIQASLRAMTEGHNPTLVIPGDLTARPLMLGLRPVGALAWRPAELSREVATAVSAQVATVIARAIAIEASARAEATRESERLQTALTDSLTHELRTPLTSIRAAATTLQQSGGLDEDGRQDLIAIIDEESSRLDKLIGEAIEMAEIDTNTVEVHIAPHHPAALLEEAIEKSRKALIGHKVSIIATDTESERPVWFDALLLGRVLRHLLENTGSHTPPGTKVNLSYKYNAGQLEFTIEDDGPGIDATDLPMIFEKFYRGKITASARKGSGMGLAIARAILIAHGGGINVTSEAGHGASFRLWVPLVESNPEEALGLLG
jgi:two-component system, OmpR family, sensor histidine kinase KdpD